MRTKFYLLESHALHTCSVVQIIKCRTYVGFFCYQCHSRDIRSQLTSFPSYAASPYARQRLFISIQLTSLTATNTTRHKLTSILLATAAIRISLLYLLIFITFCPHNTAMYIYIYIEYLQWLYISNPHWHFLDVKTLVSTTRLLARCNFYATITPMYNKKKEKKSYGLLS